MVNEPHAREAVEIARRNQGLRVGLHLTLCDGRASDGAGMVRSPTRAGLRYSFVAGTREWLRREIEAQIAKFQALGFEPAYWDGHMHLHLHPVVLSVTIPIAVSHGFRFTRLVREPGPRGVLPWIFSMLSASAAPRLRSAGVGFADAVFGLRQSGRMDLREVRRALHHSRNGLTEIYFHPGAESMLMDPAEVAAIVA